MKNIFCKILQNFGPYNKFNILAFVPLGFCAGLPLPLIGATMSAHLMEAGISYTSIGLFALAGTPYALKFIWSPIVDTLKLPFINKVFGKRKSWVLFMQLILFFFISFCLSNRSKLIIINISSSCFHGRIFFCNSRYFPGCI